jgi:integrase
MDREMIDIYSDDLITNFGQATATSLSNVLNGQLSHDSLTRSLADRELTSKDYWHYVKPTIREIQDENASLFLALQQRMRAIHQDHRPRLETIIRNAKPPEISPHDLRHTAGTQMLRQRMPVEVVSKILGQARVSITLDVYRHVLESEKKAVLVDLYPDPVPVRIVQAVAVN